jgi:DNA-binding response OmpR family regulator
MKKIVVVEDTQELWGSLYRVLRHMNLSMPVEFISTFEEASLKINAESTALVICDFNLPNLRNGLELWEELKIAERRIPFLMISGMDVQDYIRALNARSLRCAPAFLAKPFTTKELTDHLDSLFPIRTINSSAA